MPNWCSSSITFYSKNRQELEAMQAKFLDILQNGNPAVPDDEGNGFMGDYADVFFPEIGCEKIDCRGAVEYIDDVITEIEGYFRFEIQTETAWGAKIGLWVEIVDKYYPDVKIAYIAEECGCAYYLKWDDDGLFYPEEYYADVYYPTKNGGGDYIDDHYFGSVENLLEWLDEHLPFAFTHTEDLTALSQEIQSKLDEYDDDEYYCAIERYDEFSPYEFDFMR